MKKNFKKVCGSNALDRSEGNMCWYTNKDKAEVEAQTEGEFPYVDNIVCVKQVILRNKK